MRYNVIVKVEHDCGNTTEKVIHCIDDVNAKHVFAMKFGEFCEDRADFIDDDELEWGDSTGKSLSECLDENVAVFDELHTTLRIEKADNV